MLLQHLTRQSDLIPLAILGQKISIVGGGAIGSFAALQLAKMGFSEIEVWDDDVVSDENMSNQFYRVRDIGRPKVEALQEIIEDFTGTRIAVRKERYTAGQLPGIAIMAVDDMDVRRTIYEQHAMQAIGTRLVIDARMGAESIMLFGFRPCDSKEAGVYEKTLYANGQAVQERCTAKTTMYTVNLVSGLIAKVVKDFCVDGTFLKRVTWDVKTMALECWNSGGVNPNAAPSAPLLSRGEQYAERVRNTIRPERWTPQTAIAATTPRGTIPNVPF